MQFSESVLIQASRGQLEGPRSPTLHPHGVGCRNRRSDVGLRQIQGPPNCHNTDRSVTLQSPREGSLWAQAFVHVNDQH